MLTRRIHRAAVPALARPLPHLHLTSIAAASPAATPAPVLARGFWRSSSIRLAPRAPTGSHRHEAARQRRANAPATGGATAAAKHAPDVKPNIKSFEEGMLTRDFISASLYAQSSGYFNNDQRVFGVVAPQALPFTQLAHKHEYTQRLSELYQSSDSCWLTPVELYKPFYAQAIARWILDMRVRDQGHESVPKKERAEEDGRVEEMSEQQLRDLAREEAEESERNEAGVSPNPHAYRAGAAAGGDSSAGSSSSSSSGASVPSRPSGPRSSAVRAGSIPPPLRIVEMGGGNGTCALNILDYLAKHYPALYAQTEYTIVELSEVLSRRQRVVLRNHLRHHLGQEKSRHTTRSRATQPRVRLMHMSMVEWRELIEDETVFVLGLEVLDNMPHDRVRATDETQGQDSGQGQGEAAAAVQSHVYSVEGARSRSGSDPALARALAESPGDFPYIECVRPLADRWVQEYHGYAAHIPPKPLFSLSPALLGRQTCATYSDAWRTVMHGLAEWRHANKYFDNPSYWYPTTQLQLLHALRRFLPRHHLLLADFHYLPSTVEGRNAPVVAEKGKETGGKTQDHSSYLIRQGGADIFFPTDFGALHYVYQRVCMGRDHAAVSYAGNGLQPPAREVDNDAMVGAARTDLAGGGYRATPRVMTHFEFMNKYAKGYEQYTTTKNGWCALQRDYLNMSFFLS